MRTSITVSRILVGILFIFSGLIKANDPLGLSYKMQEFFEVWGWPSFNNFTLSLSVLMIVFEIVAGVAVLVGWRMRLFSWLLLLLTIFFTFLTGYALFSGKIRECGCFGDCIPLSASQSFIKDIILLLLIVFIFLNRRKIATSLSAGASVSLLTLTVVLSLGLQWYVLRHLPLMDCLPYRVGKNIPEQMRIPPGSVPDSTVISFVYEKNGKQVEFTADKFPVDFDESAYHFVKRYDKLIRKGNAEQPIRDFALVTLNGTDTTQAVLSSPGYSVMVFSSGLTNVSAAWENELKNVFGLIRSRRIPLYFITNDFNSVSSWVNKTGMGTYPSILKCDFVAIKTAARANPTLYLLKQGTIANKWSYADFDKALKFIRERAVSQSR